MRPVARRGAGEAERRLEMERRRTGVGERVYREAGVGERPKRSGEGDRESMAEEPKWVMADVGVRDDKYVCGEWEEERRRRRLRLGRMGYKQRTTATTTRQPMDGEAEGEGEGMGRISDDDTKPGQPCRRGRGKQAGRNKRAY